MLGRVAMMYPLGTLSTSALAWSILPTSSPQKQEVTLGRYPSLGKQICLVSPGLPHFTGPLGQSPGTWKRPRFLGEIL